MTEALDLLPEAVAAVANGALAFAGYGEVGLQLSLNIADGGHGRLLPAGPAAVRLESDWPDWLSLEAWLPDTPEPWRVEARLLAERMVEADLFQRVIGADGYGIDGPGLRLQLGGPDEGDRPLLDPPAGEGRRKIILLLRRPAAEVVVTRLRVLPAQAG